MMYFWCLAAFWLGHTMPLNEPSNKMEELFSDTQLYAHTMDAKLQMLRIFLQVAPSGVEQISEEAKKMLALYGRAASHSHTNPTLSEEIYKSIDFDSLLKVLASIEEMAAKFLMDLKSIKHNASFLATVQKQMMSLSTSQMEPEPEAEPEAEPEPEPEPESDAF